MKRNGAGCRQPGPSVAPRARAWIETNVGSQYVLLADVAPRARAWIETINEDNLRSRAKSPPARGRGLKLLMKSFLSGLRVVAPRARAWIETVYSIFAFTSNVVAPRARAWIETKVLGYRSFPKKVAPRARAWIETLARQNPRQRGPVAPRARAWIETIALTFGLTNRKRRPPREGVD